MKDWEVRPQPREKTQSHCLHWDEGPLALSVLCETLSNSSDPPSITRAGYCWVVVAVTDSAQPTRMGWRQNLGHQFNR